MTAEIYMVTRIWSELRALLDREEARVANEIASYPTPVAGCDQQFNYLLERRALLPGERKRLMASQAESLGADNAIEPLEAFLLASTFLDDEARCAISSQLQHHPTGKPLGTDAGQTA